MENNYILQLENVSLTVGDLHLDNVSFSLPKGYLMGLVGANGSGKSSLIKTILNVYQKDSGTIRIAGYDNQKQEILAKQQIGLVLEEVPYFASLSLERIAELHGMLYPDFSLERYRRLLSEYEVVKKERLDYNMKMWKEFSKGQQIRAQLAFALAHKPKLLIMDEPTANLSPRFRRRLRSDLQQYMEEGGSVLICTHIMSDLDKIGDYITILDNGQILASDTKEKLMDACRTNRVEDIMIQVTGRTKQEIAGEADELEERLTPEERKADVLEGSLMQKEGESDVLEGKMTREERKADVLEDALVREERKVDVLEGRLVQEERKAEVLLREERKVDVLEDRLTQEERKADVLEGRLNRKKQVNIRNRKKEREKQESDCNIVIELEKKLWTGQIGMMYLWAFAFIMTVIVGGLVGFTCNYVYKDVFGWAGVTFLQAGAVWYLSKWYTKGHNKYWEYIMPQAILYLPVTRGQQQNAYRMRIRHQAAGYAIAQVFDCFFGGMYLAAHNIPFTGIVLLEMCISVVIMFIIPYVSGWYCKNWVLKEAM